MAAEGASARQAIIRTAIILSAITAFEFLVAFTWEWTADVTGISHETMRTMKNILFMILTIFKAFYIVAEFMHLKHEMKRLIWTVLIPFAFIVWLLIGLVLEGNYWGKQAMLEDQINKQEEVQQHLTEDFRREESTSYYG